MNLRLVLAAGAALMLGCTCTFAQTKAASSSKSKAASDKPAGKTLIIPPEKQKPITVPRFEKPPTIDGKLDDDIWKSAAVFKDFVQTSPGDNIAPSKPTEVMMGYDA